MTGWTPGPWRLEDEAEAIVGCRNIVTAEGSGIASTDGIYNDGEDLANARLIAQAPAMAAKLEATHLYLREQGHDEMADEIEALLTAIKGE